MVERSLQHRDPDSKDDETLRREARVHLASEPALQLVAELIARLRELDLPWWTPVKLRERWGAVDRLGWFRERSDVRQQITTSLSGLSPRAARRKTPEFQGSLIDSVIDEGDITPRAFEAAFDPRDLAVYGPASAYWQFFRESMPWDQDTTGHQEIVAWLLRALLADRSPFEGIGRTPILTPWDVRTAIDGRLWQTRIPLEIRVAIDNARLQQERDRPGVPFHADGELAIAGPEVIAANIPPREILPVVLLAQKAMRFDASRPGPKPDHARAATPEVSPRAREVVAAGPPLSVRPPSMPPPPLSTRAGVSGEALPAAKPAADPAGPAAVAPVSVAPGAGPVSVAPGAGPVSATPGAGPGGSVAPPASASTSPTQRPTASVPPPPSVAPAAYAAPSASRATGEPSSRSSVLDPFHAALEGGIPARMPAGRSTPPPAGSLSPQPGSSLTDTEADSERTGRWSIPNPDEIGPSGRPGSFDGRRPQGKT